MTRTILCSNNICQIPTKAGNDLGDTKVFPRQRTYINSPGCHGPPLGSPSVVLVGHAQKTSLAWCAWIAWIPMGKGHLLNLSATEVDEFSRLVISFLNRSKVIWLGSLYWCGSERIVVIIYQILFQWISHWTRKRINYQEKIFGCLLQAYKTNLMQVTQESDV